MTLHDCPDCRCDVGAEWRPVPGLEGRYSVSSVGQIRNDDTLTVRRLAEKDARGYLGFSCYTAGKLKTYRVSFLVAEAFIGPRPEGMVINHIDGNKKNNAASNLEYITPQANDDHAVRTGLRPKGEDHHSAKITDEAVREIMANRYPGAIDEFIEKYGVSRGVVQSIRSGKTWTHVTGLTRRTRKPKFPSSAYEEVKE